MKLYLIVIALAYALADLDITFHKIGLSISIKDGKKEVQHMGVNIHSIGFKRQLNHYTIYTNQGLDHKPIVSTNFPQNGPSIVAFLQLMGWYGGNEGNTPINLLNEDTLLANSQNIGLYAVTKFIEGYNNVAHVEDLRSRVRRRKFKYN
jgi:hypothetical protein